MNTIQSIKLAGFLLAASVIVSPLVSAEPSKSERLTALTVYKTPTCGCCGKWVSHIEAAGFDVTVREMNDLSAVKRSNGIDAGHQSCHTAIADEGGYVFEGHIPAKYIEAFLADPPAGARGLVVPAMPVGSPGMEYQDRFSPYDVLLLKADGDYEVYAHVSEPQDAGHH
jgi:hypothetical protein